MEVVSAAAEAGRASTWHEMRFKMRDESNGSNNDGSISPEALAQIDALCETMDKEDIWARERVTEDGRTPLEAQLAFLWSRAIARMQP